MRISDEKLAEVRDTGYAVIEGFLADDVLGAARDALWTLYPRPEDYFAAPEKYAQYAQSPFAGISLFPFASWQINRLCVDPDLVDAAERFLQSTDIELYKCHAWAKYSGAANYDQLHHRDYTSHSLVVPRADGRYAQMTTFLLLSDVTADDAPIKMVPQAVTRDVPLGRARTRFGTFFKDEVSIEAPAGSLLIYRTDVFHRGSTFLAPDRARFVLLMDFQARGPRWQGRMSWLDHAEKPEFAEALTRMSPRERDLFGWPPAGCEYWNAQTLRDVQARYPKMDLSAYRGATDR